jgi:phytoene dehydrogenase-like protein
VPQGGPGALAEILAAAAMESGVEVRTKACVARLVLAGNVAAGVELKTGETIFGRAVLSSLSQRATLLGLAPAASAGFDETFALRQNVSPAGDAAILFLLNAAPDVGGKDVPQASRFIIADRIETLVANANAAREGCLADELLIEAIVPTAADLSLAPPGQHLLSVRVRGLPLAPATGWPAQTAKLIQRVVAALEPHVMHLRERIVGLEMRPPAEASGSSSADILLPSAGRISTPIEGLFLCGAAAEPVDSISGRAGRIAANIAGGWLARENRP